MKLRLSELTMLVVIGAFVAFAGCNFAARRDDEVGVGRSAATMASQPSPFAGMTERQALTRYGEPVARETTESGEIWTYVIQPKRQLIFGSDRKVRQFRWDAVRDR